MFLAASYSERKLSPPADKRAGRNGCKQMLFVLKRGGACEEFRSGRKMLGRLARDVR